MGDEWSLSSLLFLSLLLVFWGFTRDRSGVFIWGLSPHTNTVSLPRKNYTKRRRHSQRCQLADIGMLQLSGGSTACLSDIPGQSGSPAVLPGVFSQLPGSCLIGVSHFPNLGPDVLRSSFPGSSSSSHLGCDVGGSAEPALVLCALGTEHLPRCSHMDAINGLSVSRLPPS